MKNVGSWDRALRVLLGLAALSLIYFLPGYWKLTALFSLPLLFTAFTQKCVIYRLLGIHSCKIH
ncbi:YgaP family membrane protein [Brevibacillus reuszeri]|uniref:YgaP family membrane protein n=1 Tax=Brevibacillus reuszeri TaxID=54915 RepID=UPI003D211BF3